MGVLGCRSGALKEFGNRVTWSDLNGLSAIFRRPKYPSVRSLEKKATQD